MAKRKNDKKLAKVEAAIAPIPESSGPPWDWFCFIDHRGNDVIDQWHNTISGYGQGRFSRSRDQLKAQPKQNWSKPLPASNVKNHIYVIRFTDENRKQHRVFGHFHDPKAGFVMTLTGYEKDDVYHPNSYSNDAAERRSVCDRDFEQRTCKCFSRVDNEADAGDPNTNGSPSLAGTPGMDGSYVPKRLSGRQY